MVKEEQKKEQKSTVVDFQEAFEKKVAEAGKSKELKRIKEKSAQKDPSENPFSYLSEEEMATLNLTPNDIFEMIQAFEKNNPVQTAQLRDEIKHLKKTCKDHYEKWEKEKVKNRKLEGENKKLSSLMEAVQDIGASFADNAVYYMFLFGTFAIMFSVLTAAQ